MTKLGWLMVACLLCFIASITAFMVGAVWIMATVNGNCVLVSWPILMMEVGGFGSYFFLALGIFAQAKIEKINQTK